MKAIHLKLGCSLAGHSMGSSYFMHGYGCVRVCECVWVFFYGFFSFRSFEISKKLNRFSSILNRKAVALLWNETRLRSWHFSVFVCPPWLDWLAPEWTIRAGGQSRRQRGRHQSPRTQVRFNGWARSENDQDQVRGGKLCTVWQHGQTACEPLQPVFISYSGKPPLLMHLSYDSKTRHVMNPDMDNSVD